MLEVQTMQPVSFACGQELTLAEIKARFPSAISLEAIYTAYSDLYSRLYVHRVIMPYKFALAGTSLYGDRTAVWMKAGIEFSIEGSDVVPLPSVEVLSQDIAYIVEFWH